jgi:ferritin-like metal-binding protein YciE
MNKETQFEDLFQEGLGDIYDAETQIAAALPRMIAATSSVQMSGVLESHLEATKAQIARLETIFERIAEESAGRACRPVLALLEEGERCIGELPKSPVLDAAIAAVGLKVEHYEIAAYTSACALAQMLGQQDAFELLQESLREEQAAAQSLTEMGSVALSGDETDISEPRR